MRPTCVALERQTEQYCRRWCRSKGSLCNHSYRSIGLGTRPPAPFIRRSGRPIVAVHLFPHRGPIALRVGYAGQWPCIRLERLEINWQLVTFHRVASGRALERVHPSAYDDSVCFLESSITVLYLKERKAADSDSNYSTKNHCRRSASCGVVESRLVRRAVCSGCQRYRAEHERPQALLAGRPLPS
jgi:hypothetical protein